MLSRKPSDKNEAKKLKKNLEDTLKIKINSQLAAKERVYSRGLAAVSAVLATAAATTTITMIKSNKETEKLERQLWMWDLAEKDFYLKKHNPNAISLLNLFKDATELK